MSNWLQTSVPLTLRAMSWTPNPGPALAATGSHHPPAMRSTEMRTWLLAGGDGSDRVKWTRVVVLPPVTAR